jgi:uncharacterized protein YqeY
VREPAPPANIYQIWRQAKVAAAPFAKSARPDLANDPRDTARIIEQYASTGDGAGRLGRATRG